MLLTISTSIRNSSTPPFSTPEPETETMQQQQQQFQYNGTQNPGSGAFLPIHNTQGDEGWSPSTSYEFEWYKTLFRIADTENKGQIAGQAAVGFFTRSGLNFNVLEEVWSVADSRGVNFLSLPEFCTAMRLIAMAQSSPPGTAITREWLIAEGAKPLPLPTFTGTPLPPQGLTHSQGVPSQLAYAMSQVEHENGLEKPILSRIWRMSDVGSDNKLNKAEFCLAMHLIICATKKNLPVPQNLPQVLSTSLGLAGIPVPGQVRTGAPAAVVGQVDLQQYPTSSRLSLSPPSQTAIPEIPKATSFTDAAPFHGDKSDRQQQDISTPIQESVQHTQVIPDGTPPSTIHIATSGRGVRRKAKLPSVPPPSPVMGGGSYLPSTSNQGQSHTIPSSTLPGHDSSLQGLGPVEPNEVLIAGEGLLDVAKSVSAEHTQDIHMMRSCSENMRSLIEHLKSEKMALTAVVEESKEERETIQKLLTEMNHEVQTLQVDLSHLRAQRTEQDGLVEDLRRKLYVVAAQKEALRQEVPLTQLSTRDDPETHSDGMSSPSPPLVLLDRRTYSEPLSSGNTSTKVQLSQSNVELNSDNLSSYVSSPDILSDSAYKSSPGLRSPASNKQEEDLEFTGGVPNNGSPFHCKWSESSPPPAMSNAAKDNPSPVIPKFDSAAASPSLGSDGHQSPSLPPQQQDSKKSVDESQAAAAAATVVHNDPFYHARAGFDDHNGAPFASIPDLKDDKGLSGDNLLNSPSFDAFGAFGSHDPFDMGGDPFASFQGNKQWGDTGMPKKQENISPRETS